MVGNGEFDAQVPKAARHGRAHRYYRELSFSISPRYLSGLMGVAEGLRSPSKS